MQYRLVMQVYTVPCMILIIMIIIKHSNYHNTSTDSSSSSSSSSGGGGGGGGGDGGGGSSRSSRCRCKSSISGSCCSTCSRTSSMCGDANNKCDEDYDGSDCLICESNDGNRSNIDENNHVNDDGMIFLMMTMVVVITMIL